MPSQGLPGKVPQRVASAQLHGGAQSLPPVKAGELGFPAPPPASPWLGARWARGLGGSEHFQLSAGRHSSSRGPRASAEEETQEQAFKPVPPEGGRHAGSVGEMRWGNGGR